MNILSKKAKITLALVGVLGLGAFGTTAAMASTTVPPTSTSVSPSEAPGAAETADAPATTTGVETPGVSDGNDGGHADPEGADVNNMGGAAEK